MRKLKIAQLVPYYHPVIGGVEVVCQYLSEALVRRGHQVHVFTSDRSHAGSPRLEAPRFEVVNGVQVSRCRSFVHAGHYGLFPGFIPFLKYGGFDLVHAHGYRQPQSELAARTSAANGLPSILHVHGGFHAPSRLKRLVYGAYDRAARNGVANRFDQYIALSAADRARLQALGVPESRIAILRNAAEPRAFAAADAAGFRQRHELGDRPLILFLGILHAYKRPDLLLRVLPRVLAEFPNAFLLFAGPDAGEATRLRAIASALGIAPDRWRYTGPLRGAEKHAALAAADLLALPSDEDPYPLVLLEAMAHGTPVVTTQVVGQADLIARHAAGLIVPPDHRDALAEATLRLLRDAPLRATLGANARRLAEAAFSPEAAADEMEALYESVIRRKHGAPVPPLAPVQLEAA